MRRRDFIAGVASVTVAWPLAARAEQSALPVIGLLCGNSVDEAGLDALRKGLSQAGFVEGKNIAFEVRSAEGQYDRLPALAVDFVRQNVRVIVAVLATNAAVAAKNATATIPIVFVNGSDPVKQGLVNSFSHPGANVTGITFLTNTLAAKRLELLHELLPQAHEIGILINPKNVNAIAERTDMTAAARKLGLELSLEEANSPKTIDAAFEAFTKRRVSALVVEADAYFRSARKQLIDQAVKQRIPTVYSSSEFVAAGGLMGYGTSRTDAFGLAGAYAGRILNGEKPGDLPVQQSVKVELSINLKTAKALGLDVPMSLLMRVEEVIE